MALTPKYPQFSSVAEVPESTDCRQIGSIRGITSSLLGLFPKSQGDAYDRVLNLSVPVGRYATMVNDAIGLSEQPGPIIEIVQIDCRQPQQADRCAACILNVFTSEIDYVDPQAVVNRLHRATTPKVAPAQ